MHTVTKTREHRRSPKYRDHWNKGDDSIDIVRTRQALSDLIADPTLREQFLTGKDYLDWKEMISEAATWARRLERPELPEGVTAPKDIIDRLEIKRTGKKIDYFGEGKEGPKLYSGIPIFFPFKSCGVLIPAFLLMKI